jgi:hypothetical protein
MRDTVMIGWKDRRSIAGRRPFLATPAEVTVPCDRLCRLWFYGCRRPRGTGSTRYCFYNDGCLGQFIGPEVRLHQRIRAEPTDKGFIRGRNRCEVESMRWAAVSSSADPKDKTEQVVVAVTFSCVGYDIFEVLRCTIPTWLTSPGARRDVLIS